MLLAVRPVKVDWCVSGRSVFLVSLLYLNNCIKFGTHEQTSPRDQWAGFPALSEGGRASSFPDQRLVIKLTLVWDQVPSCNYSFS